MEYATSPILSFLFLLIFVVPAVFYLITLQNTLKVISPHNREMPPGQVWLLFIPLFNIVWQFIVVKKIAVSIEKEMRQCNGFTTVEPTYNIGLAFCILNVCGFIPVLGAFARLAALVCWIIHWVKVSEYKRKIETLPIRDATEDSQIF